MNPPVNSPLDIVYPVRVGDVNEELRYSLRSLANMPHRNVIISGHLPSFVDPSTVTYIPNRQHLSSKWTNAISNLVAAASDPATSDPFILFNDDFFVTQPITCAAPPIFNLGPTKDFIDYLVRVRNASSRGKYRRTIQLTSDYLVSVGVSNPICYENHTPFLYFKSEVLSVIAKAMLTHRFANSAPQVRTLYGNLYRHTFYSTTAEDVKIYTAKEAPIPAPFVSTDRPAFSGLPGAQIRALFPHPSPHELDADTEAA